VRAVRNLLAGALGPLFRDDFQALNPKLESDYIVDALDVLQRFIIGDNQTQGYTFSHPKLGQYFWEALTPTEQVQVEGRFLAWGEQTLQEFIDGKRDPRKKAEVPVYVVHNYGAHLARANQPIEKWLPLIYHQQWAQAWFTVEGAYGGYLQDVQRVWDQCKSLDRCIGEKTNKASYLSMQTRCALIKVSLHSLAANLPTALIPILVQNGIWSLTQAWAFIREMPYSRQQIDAIITLVPSLGGEQFVEALQVVQEINPDEANRVRTLMVLLPHLPETQLVHVLAMAQTIESEERRANVLQILMQRLPADQLIQVFEMAQSFSNEEQRANVLCVLAQRLPEGQLIQVLEMAQSFSNEEQRANVLCVLAQRLPEGQLIQVLEIIQIKEKQTKIDDEKSRSRILSALVPRLPEKQLGKVLATISIMGNEWQRTEVL
jgi:hypothetical protein